MPANTPFVIDTIDRRILRGLQADGRITNLRLSGVVQLAPTAVLKRIKGLTRDGVILGCVARLDPTRLGAGLMVFIEVLLERTRSPTWRPAVPCSVCAKRSPTR